MSDRLTVAVDALLEGCKNLPNLERYTVDRVEHYRWIVDKADAGVREYIGKYYSKEDIVSEYDEFRGGNWYISGVAGIENMVRGVSHCCKAIGWGEDKIEIGVIYDPLRDEVFACTQGRGSYMNSKRIRVSKTQSLEDALVVISTNIIGSSWCKKLGKLVQDIQSYSDSELNFAWLASGRIDIFITDDTNASIGKLLAQEAGMLSYEWNDNTIYANEKLIDAFRGT